MDLSATTRTPPTGTGGTSTATVIHSAGRPDVTIEYLVEGDGPPVVILPSLGRGASDYDEVAPRIAAAGYRVLRPQPRGVGGSTGPLERGGPARVRGRTSRVCSTRRRRGRLPWSATPGGRSAGPDARGRPSRPRPRSGFSPPPRPAWCPPGPRSGPYGRLRWAIDGAGDRNSRSSDGSSAYAWRSSLPATTRRPWLEGWYPSAHHAQGHAREHTPIEEYVRGGDVVPVLDLQAEHDAVVIPGMFAPLLGDRVEVRTVAGAGHALAPEQPGAMAEEIVRFVRRLDRAAA
jgi:pimeloyl-ACP methyl ester carboxylesterase